MINAATMTGSAPKPSNYGPNTPFLISQPFNLVTFLSVFSPIILVTFLVSYSLFFQNVKGFVYIGFLIASIVFRGIFLQAIGVERNRDACQAVRYTNYGNITLSTFVFTFTMMYLFLPMFQLGVVNWYLITFLIIYVFFDLGVKVMQGCLSISNQLTSIIGDVFGGALLSGAIVAAMYAGGSDRFLFFADSTANGTICSVPRKQTFKCQVFKNGELVTTKTT